KPAPKRKVVRTLVMAFPRAEAARHAPDRPCGKVSRLNDARRGEFLAVSGRFLKDNKGVRFMTRRLFLALWIGLAALLGPAQTPSADDKLKGEASFSILGDRVKQGGGHRVEVVTFVGPNGAAHVYEPTPADAKALSESKILVINGLGLE